MKLIDQNLRAVVAALSPAERRSLEEALREAKTWPDEARAVLRWLRRKLKRKARAAKKARPG